MNYEILSAKTLEEIGELKNKIKLLERQIAIKDAYCNMIWEFGVDYDGYKTPKSLKGLIDELVECAKKANRSEDKTIEFFGDGKKYNILMEELEDN